MDRLRILLIGFGSAGRAFARQLSENHHKIIERYNTDVKVVGITTGSRGALYNENGLDTMAHLTFLAENGRFDARSPDCTALSSLEMIQTAEYDVMAELTPLEIFSGQPAIAHITAALSRRKHAITANKGPIAWAYRSLSNLAKENRSLFYCETTVMDGTPIFNLADETLQLCRITGIEGILNSTTNYILEELAAGKTYDAILAEGRARGFIEEDAAMDIEGWDAAAKVTALLNVLMDANLTPLDIRREGIENITAADIQKAAAAGKVIKLLCRGWQEEDKVFGQVSPIEVPMDSIYASVHGTSSLVSIKTDLMGTVTILEENPEIEQTAYGVFSDVLRILRNG